MSKYPILYDRNMRQKGIIHAESLSASLMAKPMSAASLTAPQTDGIQMRDFVQIFFPDGDTQFFRVKSISDSVGGLVTVQMEHGIVWAEDYILPEKQDDLTDTPANVLARFFARLTDTKWRLGTIEPTERIDVQYDHPNVMQGIMDVLGHCKGYTYQFNQSGDLWYVNMVALPSEVGCEGRISRNLLTAPVINYNDQAQCTRVYVPGKSWHIDADNIAEVGVIERTINVDTVGVDDDELREQCREYLEAHKKPAVSITVDAQELASMTGEPFDRFVEGTICRLCLMDYGGVVIQERISTRIYPDLLGAPEYVQVQIASQLPDVSSQINDITVAQHKIKTSLNDVYSGVVEVDSRLTSVYNEVGLRLDAQAAEIELKASSVQVNEVDQRVNDVSLEIDGLNAEIALKAYSDDVADDLEALSSEMTVAADGIRAQIQAGDKVVSELSVTIEGLENWTSDSAGNISELTNTVRGMESKVTTVDGKVSTLINTADGLTSAIANQGVTLSELKTRSDEISAIVQNVEGDIASLAVTSNAVSAKVESMDGKVTSLVVTADGLTNNISDQNGVLSSLVTRIDEISANVQDVNGNIGQLTVKSNEVAAKVENANGKASSLLITADGLTSTIQEQGMTLSELKTRSDEISANVQDVEGNIGALTVTSNSVAAKVQSTENKVATLVLTADGLTNNIADQNQVLASFTTRIDEIAAMVTNGNGQTAQLIVTANRITQKVEDVGVSVSQFQVDLEGIHGEVVDVEENANTRMDILAGRIDLKASQETVNGMETRLRQAEIDIDGAEASIKLKASQETVNGMETRLRQAEIDIDGAESTISLKADKTYVDNLFAETITTENLSAKISALDHINNESVQGTTADFQTVIAQGVRISAPHGLTLAGTDAGWKELEVVTGAGLSVSKANTPPFYGRENELLSDGVSYVSNVTLNVTRGTIHYLGY